MNWRDITMTMSIFILPIVIVWNIIDFGNPKDPMGYLSFFLMMLITGLGSLAIGHLLADKYVDFCNKMNKKESKK